MENAMRDIYSFRFIESQRLKDQMQSELTDLKVIEARLSAQNQVWILPLFVA
jgi:hypothetical protein